MGELIGEATTDKRGLLPRQRASAGIEFSAQDVCINFSTVYNIQPFFIVCYLNGSYSMYLVNPSMYQSLSYFKARYLGRPDIEIYAKAGDGRIFIKTKGTTNGRLGFTFLYDRAVNILSIENGTTPDDFTKIDMVEM